MSHKEMSDLISSTQETFNKKMGVESLNQSMRLLKLTEVKEENNICLKLIANQGVWKCKDCQKKKESIYCNECWGKIKSEHIKHHYIYISDYICGTCDCGNLNNMEEKYVCPKHKKNSDENKNENIPEKKEFQSIHQELFEKMANYISENLNKKETNNDEFIKNINTFVDYISLLSFNSKAVLNWIAELLLENYPINEVTSEHKCKNISSIYNHSNHNLTNSCNFSRNNSQNFIYSNLNINNSNCSCPFLRYLMSVWPNNKYNTLLRFSQNYDLKISIGIFYLFLYDELILKAKNDFGYLRKEFLFSEIRIKITKDKKLLDNLLNSPKLIIKYYIEPIFVQNINKNSDIINSRYAFLKKVINNLKFDILNVLSEDTKIFFISDDPKFYLSLIDVLAKFHNINSIKWKFNNTQKETEESYNEKLLQTELSLLDIFTTMTSIIDFENENLIKLIFSYFNEKISKKQYKTLKKDEYSYHISLFRGFSIFLNRFCFYYAKKHESNVNKGFKEVKNFMNNYDECINILFLEISKLLRFIAACGEDLFIHYGQSMKCYEKTYYYTYKFVYRDFSLMKYLIPSGSVKEFFSSKEIDLENNNIDDSSFILKTFQFLKEKKKTIDIETLLKEGDNLKYMKIISRLLSITLNLIRNNGSLIWNLGSSFKSLKPCQINDPLLVEVINDDINSMKELTKALIISKAIVKGNSASYSELLNGIYYILRETIGEEELEKMVDDMFNFTESHDQKRFYSIKDKYLNNFDTNYILSPASISKAEEYLGNFKKNKVSIFNRCFYNFNKFETALNETIYNKIFGEEETIDFIMDSIIKLIKEKEYIELRSYFLNTLLNYFDIFYCVVYKNCNDFKNNLDNKIEDFIETISQNNLEEPYKSYCDLIIEKVKGNNNKEESNKKKELNINNDINKSLKEKYKSNNKKIWNKINININDDEKTNENEIQKIIIEPEYSSINEQCIYCKKNVNEKDLFNCFGKIGYYLLDKFIYNSSKKIANNLYNKYIKNNKVILSFNNIWDLKKVNARKSLRILNCGHTMHFSCYYSNYMKSDKVAISNFICPVCKKFANTFVPQVNHILKEKFTDKFIYDLFKGFNLDFILGYRNKYRKNIKKFFDEKNKILEKDKYEFNLLSEDLYKKNTQKDKNIKTIEEQKNLLKKNYKNIFISCIHLIEGFFGIKENIYNNFDLESESFNKIQKDSLLYCILQFRDFLNYFIKNDKKKEQIFLLKNLILSFRLMLKLNILKDNFFVNFSLLLFQMINLNHNKNISTMINNDQFTIILSGILFLLCVFFEYEEIEGYEKYIIYLFLPVFSFAYYFRKLYLDNSLSFIKGYKFKKNNNINDRAFGTNMNEKNFFEFLQTDNAKNSLIFILKRIVIVNYILKNNDNEDIEKNIFEINNMYDSFNLPQLKEKNILGILEELNILINNETNDKNNETQNTDEETKENIYNFFLNFNNIKRSNENNIYNHSNIFNFLIKEFSNEINKELFPRVINPNLLAFCEEIQYNFINLPKLAVDFLYEKYNCLCEKCRSRGKIGLICLDCGNKVICKNDEIQQNNNNINEINFETIYRHVELCGGGTGAFLNILDFNVIFIQQKLFSKKTIPLYLDKHGEPIKVNSIHNGFTLNDAQLQKAKKKMNNNDLIFG